MAARRRESPRQKDLPSQQPSSCRLSLPLQARAAGAAEPEDRRLRGSLRSSSFHVCPGIISQPSGRLQRLIAGLPSSFPSPEDDGVIDTRAGDSVNASWHKPSRGFSVWHRSHSRRAHPQLQHTFSDDDGPEHISQPRLRGPVKR